MTTTVEAIYENGTLKLPRLLPLQAKAKVLVTIQTKEASDEATEREAWLKRSEETLTKAWDNPADHVFNEPTSGEPAQMNGHDKAMTQRDPAIAAQPDFVSRAKAVWGEHPAGKSLSAIVSDARGNEK
jgi:predicted DNA-binding antitoxin AbrB/MazE fold protein